MGRVYYNSYDDLSEMVAAVYFNHYLENTDLVKKKIIDQEVMQVFRNHLWNEYGQAEYIVSSTMKKDTSALCNSGNEHQKELDLLSKQETNQNILTFITTQFTSQIKNIQTQRKQWKQRQYGKSRGEVQYTYSNTTMLTGSRLVYLDLKDVDEAKRKSEVIGLNGNKMKIQHPVNFICCLCKLKEHTDQQCREVEAAKRKKNYIQENQKCLKEKLNQQQRNQIQGRIKEIRGQLEKENK